MLFRHNPSPRHARLRLLTHHVGLSHRTLPQVVMLAQEEARRLGHNFVGTEQLLLGLIGESTGVFWHGSRLADTTRHVVSAHYSQVLPARSSSHQPSDAPGQGLLGATLCGNLLERGVRDPLDAENGILTLD